jgi:putative DNA primase/helicase
MTGVIAMGVIDPLLLARLPMNDLGNAQRLIARFADQLRHVPGLGWVGWNGRHWDAAIGDALARACAHKTAEAILEEARALQAEGEGGPAAQRDTLAEMADGLLKWAVRSGDAGRTSAMLAQAEGYLRRAMDAFDVRPDVICCANGVLTIGARERGDVVPLRFSPHHDPAQQLTRITHAPWDGAGAPAPLWARLIETSLPMPAERDYFQRWAGYLLWGGNPEQRLLMLQGPGQDGKSTVMNIIRRVIGLYGTTADVKTFLETTKRGGSDASPDLARLAGDMRLISVSEPNRGDRLNEGMVKQFTGGAPMTARHLNEGFFTYLPRGKVVMEVNAKPSIGGTDDGIWRRIDLILFRHKVPDAQVDRTLEERIVEGEAAGVLAWLVEGLQEWRLCGLVRPEMVQEAVDEYRTSSVPFTAWWRERVIEPADSAVAAAELYRDYADWCAVNDLEAMKRNSFGRTLTDRQIKRRKDAKGNNEYRGLSLHPRTAAMDVQAYDDFQAADRKGRR